MVPECNNKCKVVASADVIKTIFKIVYSQEYASLMVRKVGNVFLIDNFLEEEIKAVHKNARRANNSRQKLIERNLFSKFLHASVVDDSQSERVVQKFKFGRVIYWTFEETQMLIGTNIMKQNFVEDGTTRNVSLHVSKHGESLKISNAIDIWIDNLMCNIPEMVICFHTDGIVDNYKIVKTQNIPYLEGSQFSIIKIKTAVEKIFSILSNQQWQNGEVYWLMKRKNDNNLKFINLNMPDCMKTSLSYECGKLAYIFGHVQYYSTTNKKILSKPTLLDFCVTTLNKEIHPEIIASASYLIADLKLGYDIFKTSLFSLSKVEFHNCKKLPECAETRCLEALQKISDGFKCLQYFGVFTNSEIKLEKNIKSNQSFKLNLNFKKSKKQAKDEVFYTNISFLFPKKDLRAEVLPTWQNINENSDYWKMYLKLLFYQKAELAFGVLAQHYFYYDMFGLCLRSLNMMMRCNKVKTSIDSSTHSIPIQLVFVMAGDCYNLVSRLDVSEKYEAFNNNCDNIEEIEEVVKSDEQYYGINSNVRNNLQINLEEYSKRKLLEQAVAMYKESIKYEEMDFIKKKLFAPTLELGYLYFDMLDQTKTERGTSSGLRYFQLSKEYLREAINVADSSIDKISTEFTYGQLHHLLFHIHLNKMTPSYQDNNLAAYYKVYLNSVKETLQMLLDENNVNYRYRWDACFYKFFTALQHNIERYPQDCENYMIKNKALVKIVSEFDGFLAPLTEILKLCELTVTRYNDSGSYFSVGMLSWCIGSILSVKMDLKTRSNYATIVEDNFQKTTKYFSKLGRLKDFSYDMWKVYLRAIIDRTEFSLWNQKSTGDLSIPALQKQIQEIRELLEMFYRVGQKLQYIINNDFVDTQINSAINKYVPELPNLVQAPLIKGIGLLRDSRIRKENLGEIETFANYLFLFRSINRNENHRSVTISITVVLLQMGIEMKFSL